jgi:hypothetical protein
MLRPEAECPFRLHPARRGAPNLGIAYLQEVFSRHPDTRHSWQSKLISDSASPPLPRAFLSRLTLRVLSQRGRLVSQTPADPQRAGLMAVWNPDVIHHLDKLDKLVYTIYMGEIIIRGVDERLRNAFRAWCVERGSTMKAELVRYMKRIVKERKRVR